MDFMSSLRYPLASDSETVFLEVAVNYDADGAQEPVNASWRSHSIMMPEECIAVTTENNEASAYLH